MTHDQNNKNAGTGGVSFQDEGHAPARAAYSDSNTSTVVRWVIGHSGGLIRDEKKAGIAVMGFVALAIVVSLVFVFSGGAEEPIRNIDPETGREIFPGQIPGGI